TAPIGSALHRGEGLSGKVWNTGDPLIVNDYRHWEGRSPIYDGYPWTAVVGVPVCWGDEFLGVLDVLKNAPDSFSTADAELLSLFANQAAIAIKNARLFRAEREQRELAEALRQATAAVSSTLDLDEVLDRILDQMDRVIPGDASNVMLIEGERARFVRWRGYEKFNGGDHLRSVAPHIADIPFLQQMQETGEPVIIPATHTNDRWKRASGWVRSYAGAPIRVRDEIIGFLSVNSATPGFFSQTHTDHLRAFADQASLAVENARMYHEVRQRNRELALLNRITAASAASREIETILEVVCRELALAFSVPQSAAALFNEEKTEAFIVAEYLAEGRPSALGEVIPAEDNPASQYLLKHKTPLVINDAQTDPRQAIIHRLMRRRGTISLLLLPLVIDGEVVGTLGIDAIEHRPFSAKEVELAQRMAEQVSGALARTRLEETQRRLSTAVEQAAESIIIADTDGHIVYVNPAFRRTTGYSLAEVVGQDLRCLNNGEQDTNAHREMWRALQSGRTWQGRMVNRKKDGSSCTMDSTITPVRNQVGEIVNYVATMRDVTREVELEEQFRQAQKMEALGRLAGGVAHDFNNLLTVIHISTRLLERDLHPKDPLCEHVQRIRDVGERAAKLNKQLLSFSRRQVIEPRVLNLNDLVSDLSRMLQRIIGEDIELTLSLAEDLWSVKVDSAQMDQVIMNVVVNARDAMPEGGLLTIETANVVLDRAYTARHVEAKVGEHVLLSIGDTGVGMDSEVKAHLFEPFFTTKERGKGTGLGLATVFGIVKQSRGHIEVESAPEQGATFRIYLPRAEMEEVRTQRPSASARLTRGTETVLVVEDEDAVRELTVRILKRRGYDVLVATNGAEALRISEQYDGCIDLLLTDVVMPQMSGPELVKRLNAQRPDVRVIYMSGYTNEKIVQHGALEPDAAFVAKPLTLESLTQKVRTVLDGRT
ncbi:MAG: GAF domain-containing protein, partial [Anaerolineae bacterium]